VTSLYKQALSFYKTKEALPESILTILMGSLSILKSIHTQPETTFNSPVADQIQAERNNLAFCSNRDIYSVFMPYLYDLSQMDPSMCQEDPEFLYPPTV
jgi:hypothetical protein